MLYREWLASGILEPDGEPATWVSVESYVGPDGIARERHGTIVSLPAEPYETGAVLPHERTYELIREERLRLLRATHVQPEPILLLADGAVEVEAPLRPPDIEVGRHAALALRDSGGARPGTAAHRRRPPSVRERGRARARSGRRARRESWRSSSPPRMPVSTSSRLTGSSRVGPTSRSRARASRAPRLRRRSVGSTRRAVEHSVAVAYRRGEIELVRGGAGELDTELVDRHGLDGIGYTPRVDEATAAVDRGEADVAFLLREPRVEDGLRRPLARARRMPQKSTYFYPKPLSGLLFHPVLP